MSKFTPSTTLRGHQEGDMKTVNEDGRKQLLGYLVNERQSQAETREWVKTWLDAFCPPLNA